MALVITAKVICHHSLLLFAREVYVWLLKLLAGKKLERKRFEDRNEKASEQELKQGRAREPEPRRDLPSTEARGRERRQLI